MNSIIDSTHTRTKPNYTPSQYIEPNLYLETLPNYTLS